MLVERGIDDDGARRDLQGDDAPRPLVERLVNIADAALRNVSA